MEFSIETGAGMTLKGDFHIPTIKTERLIVFIHGVGDHFGRYAEWSQYFTDKGIAVIGLDLPGHGRSPGKRGHIKNYHEYNSIIESVAKYGVSKLGPVPVGLYGHSLGGNIILNYLLTNTFGFNFAIATSSWIKLVSSPSDTTIAIARFISRIFPSLLQGNGLKLEHISRAKDVYEKYDNDPLVHDRISVRLGIEAMNAADRILEMGSSIDIPVLLLHGGDDKITASDGSKALAELNKNMTIKIWEGGYHELQNEPFKDEVFEYIFNWITLLSH